MVPNTIEIKGEVSIWTLTIIILSEAGCCPQRLTLECITLSTCD